jgi:hypothetical protein
MASKATPFEVSATKFENGFTGYFLPVDAPQEEFVKRVEEVMLDREKLIKMGLAAQEFSEAFDISEYCKKVIKLYMASLAS